MRPLGAYLRRRFGGVVLWDHPGWLDSLPNNQQALRQFVSSLPPTTADRRRESKPSIAFVSHSFGDWIVRDTIAALPQLNVTHVASIAPVVRSNRASKMAAWVVGDRIDEIAVMRRDAIASAHLRLPRSTRHLTLWAKLDCWVTRRDGCSPQTIDQTVWATHNTAPMHPGVMVSIEQFLRCQSVQHRRPVPAAQRTYEPALARTAAE